MLLLLGLGGLSAVSPVGIGLALTAAVTYAVYTIVASSLPVDADVSLLMAIVATSALGSVTIFTVASGQPLTLEPDPVVLGWVVTYVVVGTILAMLLHQRGITRVGAATGGILSSIEPLVAAGAVALVYGEAMTPVQLAGGLVILAGVVVVQLPSRPSPAPRQLRGLGENPGPSPSTETTTSFAGSRSLTLTDAARTSTQVAESREAQVCTQGHTEAQQRCSRAGARHPGASGSSPSGGGTASLSQARPASAMTSSGRGGTVWSNSRTSNSWSG